MVFRILKWLFFAMIAAFLFVWLLGGWWRHPDTFATNIKKWDLWSIITSSAQLNILGTTTLPRGVDISPLLNRATIAQQDTVVPVDARYFGDPSPYRGSVTLSSEGAQTADERMQFVVLRANSTSAANLAGWSLQSAITGAQAYIPRGASRLFQGTINLQSNIALEPGMVAIVATGPSPVGTSFRTNACVGYLAQTQRFMPPLGASCPSTSDASWNARVYGASCVDYVESLGPCALPSSIPANVGAACSMFVQDVFSYNGCVQENQNDANFLGNEWRIYLGSPRALWRETHDVIRLLDPQGRTVDAVSY